MNAASVTFLVIGGLGIAVLAVALFVGDIAHVGHPELEGPFSLPSVAGFVGAFGFGGAIAAALTGGGLASVIVALIAGVAVAIPAAWGTVWLARAANRMRTDATPTRLDLVGRPGVIVTAIPAQGYGEVRITMGGQPVKLNARSDRPVPLGARVFVIEAPSDTSVIVEQTTSD